MDPFKLENEHLAKVYQKLPVCIVKGRGALVYDEKGKEYIDCMGGYGVAIVGHCNDKVVKALKDQLDKLMVCHGSIYNDARAELIDKLLKVNPKELNSFYFGNSGTEAVECALKVARKKSGKIGVIAMMGSFHGKTLGALSVTYSQKYRSIFEPLLQGVKFVKYGKVEEVEKALDASFGSIIVEPIQGESGIHIPPKNYLYELRKLCDNKGIILILDEVQTGFGRTGEFWCFQHEKIIPDIVCSAKGIGGGFPLSVTIAKKDIMDSLDLGEHTSTFGGNPLACKAASAALDALIEDKLIENAKKMGEYFLKRLEEIKEKHRIVREVRGLGLMIGVELRFEVKDVILKALERGVIMLYSGRNVLRFLPPLVIEEKHIDKVVEVLDDVLKEEEKKIGI